MKVDIPETTRGALYSFVYNVGAGNFRTSTLLRKINQGDIKGACDQLRRWTYAGGKQWKGLLNKDLAMVARQINPYIKVDIPETTRGALYSFVYNVGAGNFRTSTLLRKINQGDIKGACDQLRRWTYAGGKQWKGLMTRREIEREVCLWGQQ
ncbi:hypothetical protein ACN68_07520 [Escherichia coli]|uniref:glycoside hydrolase family protein n=1 Tax=Escherichia coli TaxID=562 RepID=UPI000945DA71|nr:glycoside hydrolase family protein [Escherichia coli]OKT71971.1 hypothetical protein ACN68_07520 [Escherichia coli]